MEKIIKELASKYNLSEELVEKIVRSEFNFVAETMSEGNFDSVRLHHFGVFGVKPNRLKQLHEIKKQDTV